MACCTMVKVCYNRFVEHTSTRRTNATDRHANRMRGVCVIQSDC